MRSAITTHQSTSGILVSLGSIILVEIHQGLQREKNTQHLTLTHTHTHTHTHRERHTNTTETDEQMKHLMENKKLIQLKLEVHSRFSWRDDLPAPAKLNGVNVFHVVARAFASYSRLFELIPSAELVLVGH
jgi:hypothetical protein